MLDIEESRRWRFLLSPTHASRSMTLKIEDIDCKDHPNKKNSIFDYIDSTPVPPPVSLLVLMTDNFREKYHYILWNPGTGECRDDLAATPHFYLNNIYHGFRHDSSTDNYKILRVAFTTEMKIWILNVGSNNNKILSFSLVEDKFEKRIPLPKLNTHYHVSELRTVGGKLSVLAFNDSIQNGTCNIDIWVMKKDHVKDSCEKKVTLSFEQMPLSCRSLMPLQILRDGRMILAIYGEVMIYDPKGNTSQMVNVLDDNNFCMVPSYIGSSVSPSVGEKRYSVKYE
uniref:F-box associated domain-containing protein n=1 Tax=Kalanchoe fedtschenkoi TaxID=63787 RepID=A0A7N0SV89_KALFE